MRRRARCEKNESWILVAGTKDCQLGRAIAAVRYFRQVARLVTIADRRIARIAYQCIHKCRKWAVVPIVSDEAEWLFSAGVSDVRPWTLVWAKLVNCVLALAVSAQPILAQHCPCQCANVTTSEIAPECDDPNCCPHASDHCHHGSLKSCAPHDNEGAEKTDGVVLFGMCPCGCPSDCDCHLRHAPIPAAPQGAVVRVAKQLTDVARLTALAGNHVAPRVYHNAFENVSRRSSATLCAVLCRFTI